MNVVYGILLMLVAVAATYAIRTRRLRGMLNRQGASIQWWSPVWRDYTFGDGEYTGLPYIVITVWFSKDFKRRFRPFVPFWLGRRRHKGLRRYV